MSKLNKKTLADIELKLTEPREGFEWHFSSVSSVDLGKSNDVDIRVCQRPIIKTISNESILACGLDVEANVNSIGAPWHVFDSGIVTLAEDDRHPIKVKQWFLGFEALRIRQNHKFGRTYHQSSPQIPNGLLIKFQGFRQDGSFFGGNVDSQDMDWSFTGCWEVLGAADGYRYEYEDES